MIVRESYVQFVFWLWLGGSERRFKRGKMLLKCSTHGVLPSKGHLSDSIPVGSHPINIPIK